MKPTSAWNLVVVYAVATAIGWIALQVWQQPLTPWFTLVVFAVMAVFLIWRGREVRKMLAGKLTSMTPLGAAQVLATAKASALFAAILGGVGFSSVIEYLPRLSSPLGKENVIGGALVGLSSIVVVVVALMVERWCVIESDDDDKHDPQGPLAAGA